MDQARVVVIGGGITGCSVAYHLAAAGWTDVLLVEKAQLTAGSTCQAAGLVTVFNPSATMMAFRRYSVELYERLGVFERSGSLRLASSPAQLLELERAASRARGIGLDAEVVSAAEARRLMPALGTETCYGAVYLAQDGYARPAHRDPRRGRRGARARRPDPDRRSRVTGIELDRRRAVAARPDRGGPDRHRARRRRGRDLGSAGGGDGRRLHPVDAGRPPARRPARRARPRAAARHALLPRSGQPRLRPERARRDALRRLRGGTRPLAGSTASRGITPPRRCRPTTSASRRSWPARSGASRSSPTPRSIRLVCHPDAMTPDANPLLGPMPGVRGFWVAAGLSLNGFGGGGGIGRAIAGWITAGDPGVDIAPYRAWRFARRLPRPGWSRGPGARGLRRLLPPSLPVRRRRGRPAAAAVRRSTAGSRRPARCSSSKAGWERADLHRPGEPWRRAGRDQRAYGWTRPPWFERVGDEARAVRERVGLDRPELVRQDRGRAARARSASSSGSPPTTSTARSAASSTRRSSTRAAGCVADVTVTRLGPSRFRVVTGAGYVASRHGLARGAPARTTTRRRDPRRERRLGVPRAVGPAARDVLGRGGRRSGRRRGPAAAAGATDPGRAGTRPRLADQLRGRARLGAVGRPGTGRSRSGTGSWPPARPRDRAVRLPRARIAPAREGLPLLRDGPDDARDPDEAGLGAFVRPGKGPFIGRDALLAGARPRRRAPTGACGRSLIGGADYQPVFGGEAVRLDGEVSGGCAARPTATRVGRTVGTVYLPPASPRAPPSRWTSSTRGSRRSSPRTSSLDPAGTRMRG